MFNFDLSKCDRVLVHHTHGSERPGIILFTGDVAGIVNVANIEFALEQIEIAVKDGSLELVDSADTYCLFVPPVEPPTCPSCGGLLAKRDGLLLGFPVYQCPTCHSNLDTE